MGIADKINGLNGSIVSRSVLKNAIAKAEKQEQFHIAKKLQEVLDTYPNKETFEIEIVKPLIEVIPSMYLSCLDCEEVDDEPNGLAKPVSPNDIYQMITDRMIEMIKTANTRDAGSRWNAQQYGKGYTIPFNFISKKRYRGVNIFLLTGFEVLENPYFLTFKQIEEKKGTLKKGSKGSPVVYFTVLYKIEDSKRNIDFGTYDKKKAIAFADEKGFSNHDIEEIPILKYYNVFNGKDIENIDFDLDNFKVGFIDKDFPADEENKLPIAEAIIKKYPAPAPPIKFGGNRAFYSPASDFIKVPFLADFNTVQDYYRTLMHELAHSTGHRTRLERDFTGKFGTKKYAFEELVAELGATFLSAEAGIIWHNDYTHASYLKSWNNVLTHLKDDNRFIMKAATLAQKAADFILQFDESGNPLYFEDLEAIKLKKQEPKKKPVTKKRVSKKNEFDGKKVTEDLQNRDNAIMQKITLEQRNDARKIWNTGENKKIDWLDFLEDYANNLPKTKAEAKPKASVTDLNKRKRNQSQLSLFGAKKKGALNAIMTESDLHKIANEAKQIQGLGFANTEPAVEIISSVPKCNISKKYKTAVDREIENKTPKILYKIKGDLARFLGDIEIKPVQSLAITLDSNEGGGKTHTVYQWANEFFEAGYRPIIWSLEEHATSGLSTDKAKKYFGNNISMIPIESEISGETKEETYNRIKESINDFDVIIIDSWAKVVELNSTVSFDQDFRKKYDGKLFIVIFQRTSTGEMRGGAKSGFDGDIVLKVEVDRADFRNNYVYNHKNRYNYYVPQSDLKYSPAIRALLPIASKEIKEEEKTPEQNISEKLTFSYVES